MPDKTHRDAQPQPEGDGSERRDLVDDQLLEEIALLTDVIAEVADSSVHLSGCQVDRVLGVNPRSDLEDDRGSSGSDRRPTT